MTKTLTEQWREGTLPKGWYYVKTHCEEIKKLYCGDGESLELDDPETSAYYFYHRKHDKGQVEVLAPVPTYEQFVGLIDDSKELDKAYDKIKLLEKKLEIATKALNGIRDVWANNPSQFSYIARIANRKAKTALQEMEGVK